MLCRIFCVPNFLRQNFGLRSLSLKWHFSSIFCNFLRIDPCCDFSLSFSKLFNFPYLSFPAAGRVREVRIKKCLLEDSILLSMEERWEVWLALAGQVVLVKRYENIYVCLTAITKESNARQSKCNSWSWSSVLDNVRSANTQKVISHGSARETMAALYL